jgi:hypothetical protein
MAFLFARNKQKVIADLARDTRGLLEKLKGVEALPAAVSLLLIYLPPSLLRPRRVSSWSFKLDEVGI